MTMLPMLRLLLLALASSAAAATPKRMLSTWVAPGKGGPMGDDLTEALAWVTVSAFARLPLHARCRTDQDLLAPARHPWCLPPDAAAPHLIDAARAAGCRSTRPTSARSRSSATAPAGLTTSQATSSTPSSRPWGKTLPNTPPHFVSGDVSDRWFL